MNAAADRRATLVAALIMICGMTLIPIGDTFNKAATQASDHTPIALAWWRFAVGTALVTPIALWRAERFRFDGRFVGAVILRGVLIAGGVSCITTALSQVPLADAFGAFFIGPFVALVLARWLLGEEVGLLDWGAIAIGFVGVLLVVRPGAGMSPGILWAVAAGCFYGGYITATRATSRVGHPISQLAGQFAAASLVLLPLALFDPRLFEPQVPGLLLGSGAGSALGNLLAIIALARGTTSVLAPLIYSQLVLATILSVAVFGDPLRATTLMGLALILVAGVSRVISR